MSSRSMTAGFVVTLWLGVMSALVWAAQSQERTFRADIAAVPLDIRVVDRQGRPITGLTREDFVIYEDGVQQPITHFEPFALAPRAGPAAPVRSSAALSTVALSDRRIVYIELGRLSLRNPQFGLIEALTTFLRQRLLPQDYAVISSFGRMTDLTSDHEALAQVIERLTALHAFAATSRGRDTLGRLSDWRREPADSPVRQALDQAFAPATSGLRLSLRPEAEFKKTLDLIQSNFMVGTGGPGQLPSDSARSAAQHLRRDTLTLLGAIQYLRFLEGNKHLIYFQVGEIAPKAVDDDRALGRIANEARVSLHLIARTNGLPARPTSRLNLDLDMSAKNMAEWTGGTAFSNRWPTEALAIIDDVSRSGYLVAYSPIKSTPDERYRKITARVRRPAGARVLVRESYRSTAEPAAYDPVADTARQHMLTVAEFPGGADDLGVTVAVRPAATGSVAADVTIDVKRVHFTPAEDRHVAKLEVAVFATDAREGLLGQRWITLDLKLGDATWTKALSEGLTQTVTLPVSGRVQYVKAVAYDYATSRAGAAIAEVK